MSLIEKLEQGGGVPGASDVIAQAAKHIGCEEAVLQAIIMVESAGAAYDSTGRLIILPEKHIFHRYLPSAKKAVALAQGLSARKWKKSNYRGLGRSGSNARWSRLRKMVRLDEVAGFKSASYGAPQIMGFNHKICGSATVQDFVSYMAESEANQIEAFLNFLLKRGLKEALVAKDFRAVARVYNGPGQVAHYSKLMRNAYLKISKGKSSAPSMDVEFLRIGSDGRAVRDLQERLVGLGYNLVVDGDFGPETRRQVAAFQIDNGLTADGIVGPLTEKALEEAGPREARSDLTVKDLRERGSQTVKQADRVTRGGWIGVATAAATALMSVDAGGELGGQIEELQALITKGQQLVKQFDPVIRLAQDNPAAAILAVAALAIYFGHKIKERRLSDAQNWRHLG